MTTRDNERAKAQLFEVLHDRAVEVYGVGATLENLTRLSGGASRETWSFDVATPAQRLPLILKRDPVNYETDGTITSDEPFRVGVSRSTEGRLIELAALAGVPVPDVAFYVTPDEKTTDGFVMQRLDGETLGLHIIRDEHLADARRNLAFECGHAAARLHSIPAANLPELESRDTRAELDYHHNLMSSVEHPYPGFEYGFRWLEERLELAGDRHTLVHGDYRNGNILVGPDGLRGVLDWEIAHLGNPISDLGWMCVRSWRYGYLKQPVGGFGEISELLAGYEAGGGGPVSEDALRFWEVFGTLRWGMLCINMAFTHLNGPHESLEQAAVGRRTAETEYDLLQLID